MSTRDTGLNRALEQTGQNILEAFIQKAQMDFRERELAAQKEMEANRLSLEKEKFSESKRYNAFLMFDKLVPFMKVGVPLAQQPVFHDVMATMLPGEDPANPEGLGGIIPNPVTFETIKQAAAQQWAGLPESPEKQRVRERMVNKDLIGEPLSAQELALRDNTVEFQARSLQSLSADANMLDAVGRKMLGLEQPIHITVGGKKISFDTSTAAQIWAQLYGQQLQFAFERTQAGKQNAVDEAKEVVDQMGKLGIVISRPNATAIINATRAEDKPGQAPGTAAQAAVNELAQGSSDQVRAALGVYLYGAKISEFTKSQFLKDNPKLAKYFEMREMMKQTMPPDEVSKMAPFVAKAINEASGYDEVPYQDRFSWFNPGDWFGHSGSFSGTFFGPGTVEDAINDTQAFRAGQISVVDLMRKWQGDTATVNAIIRDAKVSPTKEPSTLMRRK